MNEKIKELRELRRLAEEIAAEIETIQDGIKAEMTARGVDQISGDDWRVTWRDVTSSRIDTTAMKKELPAELIERYTKTTTAKRFTIH